MEREKYLQRVTLKENSSFDWKCCVPDTAS